MDPVIQPPLTGEVRAVIAVRPRLPSINNQAATRQQRLSSFEQFLRDFSNESSEQYPSLQALGSTCNMEEDLLDERALFAVLGADIDEDMWSVPQENQLSKDVDMSLACNNYGNCHDAGSTGKLPQGKPGSEWTKSDAAMSNAEPLQIATHQAAPNIWQPDMMSNMRLEPWPKDPPKNQFKQAAPTSKIQSAIAAALAESLGEEACCSQLAKICLSEEPANSLPAMITQRVEQKLVGALADCLEAMQYPESKALAMAQGDFDTCSDLEERCMTKLRTHIQQLVSAFKQLFPVKSSGQPHSAGSCATSWQVSLIASMRAEDRLSDHFKLQLGCVCCQMWAAMNVMKPHPSRQVKEGLASLSGRTVKQVNDWFTNWRARQWKPMLATL